MQRKSKLINLRGHHLICIHTFKGRGYSSEFIGNMHQIVNALDMPVQPVRIVEGLDHICKFCPYRSPVSCLKGDDKVRNMDIKSLSILGVKPGEVYRSSYLSSKTKEAICEGLFCEVCMVCDWFAPHCSALLCGG